jgi:hypothetical protein
MGASHLIPLEDVWRMLDTCLPGWTRRTTDHHHRIYSPTGAIYPSLPLGAHGHRRDAAIQAGHVRNLARQFDIEACARQRLPTAFD